MALASSEPGALGDQAAWVRALLLTQTASSEPTTGTVAEKERLVRFSRYKVVWQVRGDILMAALQERLAQVKQDCAKSETENEMLETYVDSITKNLASQHD